jgi:phosphomannomutase
MTRIVDERAVEAPHSFDSSLLRECDIRGIVGQTFTVADTRVLSGAFGTITLRPVFARTLAPAGGRGLRRT